MADNIDRKKSSYMFYGETTSLCEKCLALVPAKIIIEDDNVYFKKHCKEHGSQKTLVSTDSGYYRETKNFIKPGDKPEKYFSKTEYGCPYDCGLCPDHEQHSCLALIEITDHCDLTCPVCFAESSPHRNNHLDLKTIEFMMDKLVEAEGKPDLLQISGGEPTRHPDIIEILKLAKTKPIRHIMLNTNGVRISEDKAFVKELTQFQPGFEVYLQFDSLDNESLENLRGEGLEDTRLKALEVLEEFGISTTLVAVVKKGLNESEINPLINFALGYKCVRGVTFQPVQDAGRNANFDAYKDRICQSDIRREIIKGDNAFGEDDVIPLPCNPGQISIAYALRQGRNIVPITSLVPKEELLRDIPNTISFEQYPELKKALFNSLTISNCTDEKLEEMRELLCCLPKIELPSEITYENIFRVSIIEFMDRHNFCLGGVKRSCIHFVTPKGEIIPFDTYNLFYRNGEIEKIRKND